MIRCVKVMMIGGAEEVQNAIIMVSNRGRYGFGLLILFDYMKREHIISNVTIHIGRQ